MIFAAAATASAAPALQHYPHLLKALTKCAPSVSTLACLFRLSVAFLQNFLCPGGNNRPAL